MKIVYLILGFVGLMLGGIGAVLPILPSFPFLLLAAFGFAKSNEKLHAWFIHTELYKKNLDSYVENRSMTKATKIKIMCMVSIIMSMGAYFMESGRLILLLVWILHVLYFSFRVKTI